MRTETFPENHSVNVELPDGKLLHVNYDITVEIVTWTEGRGQHFGTPCNEEMGEEKYDMDSVEVIDVIEFGTDKREEWEELPQNIKDTILEKIKKKHR